MKNAQLNTEECEIDENPNVNSKYTGNDKKSFKMIDRDSIT
jgi:hypothetical protein